MRLRRPALALLVPLLALRAGGVDRAEPFEVGVTSSLDKVFAERPYDFEGRLSLEATVELARNEYEATQLVAFPSEPLARFTLQATDLERVGGGTPLPADRVAIALVGYVNLKAAKVAGDRVGWYPDALLPPDPIALSPGVPQPYLVTVRTDSSTVPGDYVGRVVLRGTRTSGDTVSRTVRLTVRVWDFVLPRRSRFKSTVLCDWGLPKRMWPGERFTSEQLRAVMLRVADLGFRNRLPPTVCLANGLASWNWQGKGNTTSGYPTHDGATFNAERTGALIDFMLARGANHFFIGLTSNPYERPEEAAAREQRLRRYLADYAAYLRRRGLLDLAYVYGVDEPWGPAVADAKRVYALVKSVDPGLRLMQNTNQNNDRVIGDFLGSFDALDLNLGWFDVTRLARYRRANPDGLRDVWWNVNLWPDTHPNLFLEYPLVDARIIGPMSFKYSIQGFEYWDLLSKASIGHYYPVRRGEARIQWDVGRQSLDGALVYPGARDHEIYSSLRYESFRDGMEDLEYLYLLADREPTNPLLRVEIVGGLSDFATRPEAILAFRRQVAAALTK